MSSDQNFSYFQANRGIYYPVGGTNWRFGRWVSFSKAWFSGSILTFGVKTYWDFPNGCRDVYLSSKCYWVWLGKGGNLANHFMAFHDPGDGSQKWLHRPKNGSAIEVPQFEGKTTECESFRTAQYYIPWKLVQAFPPYTPSSQIGNPRLSYISGRDGEEWANLDEKNAMIRNQWPGILKNSWSCQS